MKAVILAGGLGTRLGEETIIKPKPLVEIGGKPIIWHIMKHYSHYGINDFVILLGYKGYMIKEFFDNYRRHLYDMKIDFKHNKSEVLKSDLNIEEEKWTIELIDTGENSMTGGRLKRAYKYLQNDFEIEISQLLFSLINHEKFKIVTKLNIGTYKLDICIINKKTDDVVLGILCDSISYTNSLKRMVENLDSQKLLEDRGYPIFRITLIE